MVKVPLSYDGHHAGNFVWDFRGAPVVKDLVGQVVSAQAVPRQAFPEDSVGITLLNPRLDTLEVAVVKPGFGAGVKLSMSALKIAPAVAGRIALPR